MMHVGAAARAIAENREGRFRVAYKDPGGVWTIGLGHTGPEVHAGLVWTDAQIDEAFAADMATAERDVNRCIGPAATTQAQFDAMCDMAFNVGGPAFAGSTLIKMHLAGNHNAAADQFLRWHLDNGKSLRGLRIRCAMRRLVYLGRPVAEAIEQALLVP